MIDLKKALAWALWPVSFFNILIPISCGILHVGVVDLPPRIKEPGRRKAASRTCAKHLVHLRFWKHWSNSQTRARPIPRSLLEQRRRRRFHLESLCAMVSLFISFVMRTTLAITVSAVAELLYLSIHKKMPCKQVLLFPISDLITYCWGHWTILTFMYNTHKTVINYWW